MKINSAPFSLINHSFERKQNLKKASENPKAAIKEQVQRNVAQIQAAANHTGQDNPKVQALLDKFKSGKKLTFDEMNYIRKHAPGLVAEIEKVQIERAMYEQAMKASPTKSGVHLIALQASQQISKHASPEQVEVRAKHLADAVNEYTATEEYKQKPELLSDSKKRKQTKDKDNDIGKLYASNRPWQAYEQQMINAKFISNTNH